MHRIPLLLCKKPWSSLLLLFLLLTSTYSRAGSTPHDTVQVEKWLKLGLAKLGQGQPDSAGVYAQQASKLSRKIGYLRGVNNAIGLQIKVLHQQGKFKEALDLAQEGVQISKKLDKRELARAYNNIGFLYSNMGSLKVAVTHFLQALRLAEELKDAPLQMKYGNNLASVFGELNDIDKCFQYSEKSYRIALQLKDTAAISAGLTNMGASELIRKRYNKASKYLLEVLRLGQLTQNPEQVLYAYENLGETAMEQRYYQQALSYYQQGLQVLHYHQDPLHEVYIYKGLATVYLRMNLPDQSLHYLSRGLALSKSLNATNELRLLYQLGAEVQEKLNNPRQALEYQKKYQALNDSLMSAETRQSVQRMEIEFQTSQKEKEIAQQNLLLAQNSLEIERKNNLIYLALVAVVALLSVIIIFYMRYRDKQKANAQHLRVLQQESELKVLMARIDGEEKERSRLARELHDGVGGLLSATKMHLSVLQNEVDWAGQAQKFQHTSSMLDAASREIRSIAHNLSPDMLLRYELDQALANFCQTVSNDSLQVDFYYLGEPLRVKNNFKLVLYRMVQELVNNVIKHAGATQALVQLSHHEHILTLTVEDNGVGFEENGGKGIGLTNLQARVKDMQGELSIESAPGRGTTVYAEFDVLPHLDKDVTETTTI
ncbi:tetratricopeptide repeat-containing sensor histidine kinase [Telluribacter humicola]|uniref:tetratricopeptide repeat-containing sensor histidine kinase n=1 Tax=Telluribacter humicola TaxID=1720261 RepID=UPI001A9656E6|nr:tetratricopeptide repeat protein [Telluribacter humicola]